MADTRLLKYTYSAQSDENCIWKIEDTVFTFYTNGCMEDYSEKSMNVDLRSKNLERRWKDQFGEMVKKHNADSPC